MLLGLIFSLESLQSDWNEMPIVALLDIVSTAMKLSALVLLFGTESNAWYARRQSEA